MAELYVLTSPHMDNYGITYFNRDNQPGMLLSFTKLKYFNGPNRPLEGAISTGKSEISFLVDDTIVHSTEFDKFLSKSLDVNLLELEMTKRFKRGGSIYNRKSMILVFTKRGRAEYYSIMGTKVSGYKEQKEKEAEKYGKVKRYLGEGEFYIDLNVAESEILPQGNPNRNLYMEQFMFCEPYDHSANKKRINLIELAKDFYHEMISSPVKRPEKLEDLLGLLMKFEVSRVLDAKKINDSW